MKDEKIEKHYHVDLGIRDTIATICGFILLLGILLSASGLLGPFMRCIFGGDCSGW
jgi:hypothetical protein